MYACIYVCIYVSTTIPATLLADRKPMGDSMQLRAHACRNGIVRFPERNTHMLSGFSQGGATVLMPQAAQQSVRQVESEIELHPQHFHELRLDPHTHGNKLGPQLGAACDQVRTQLRARGRKDVLTKAVELATDELDETTALPHATC